MASRQNASPEAELQIAIHNYLKVALPPEVLWSASLTGAWLGQGARVKAKAMGVRRGVPDMVFLPPDGIARWIELKRAGGRQSDLSFEQREWRDQCKAAGTWAFAQSIDDVARALTGWKVKLRAHPFVEVKL